MSNPLLLRQIEMLGRAFLARGMVGHAKRLRVFWLAAKHGLLSPRNELNVSWSESHVVEWMQTLRLPPFEHDLVVRPRGSGCPRCKLENGEVPSTRTVTVWPEGARFRCDSCGAAWLELDSQAFGSRNPHKSS